MNSKREIQHAAEHLNDMRTINLYAEMLYEYHALLVEKLGEEEAEYIRKFVYKEASIKAERYKWSVQRMTVSEAINKKLRDTIRSLREDEQRTARVLNGMCEKIDELTKKTGTGKSILRALYYSDEGPHTDIPDWVKKGGK